MKILVTGVAGFIGSFVVKSLVKNNIEVVGIDNINDYYDTQLKLDRLGQLGIQDAMSGNKIHTSTSFPDFRFIKAHVEDQQAIRELFACEQFDYVCHLAAQAGVRYSLENPQAYIQSNIDGFLNILEGCRKNKVKHLVYASSSSVYGLNGKVPFSEKDEVSHPVSLYAATKKANELMAHSYSSIYHLPTTGLRFFIVYGPWGRPDMSPFLFIDAILRRNPIRIFNHGKMLRDFTYIDDIVEGIVRIIPTVATPDNAWDSEHPDPATSPAPYRIYNIGNSSPVKLSDYIETIERVIGMEAEKIYLPMQPGDVYQTNADTSLLEKAIGFRPDTSLETGITRTVEWFKEYYHL